MSSASRDRARGKQSRHRACDLGMRATVAKLVGDLVVAHRDRPGCPCRSRRGRDLAAVGQLDVDDRRHLVEARGLGLRVDARSRSSRSSPCTSGRCTTSSVNSARPAWPSSSRIAMQNSIENLACSSLCGPMMDQRIRHVGIGADADVLHVFGLDVVLADQAQHLGHAGMGQRARRMRLDRDAGLGEGPGLAELADRWRSAS